MFVKICGITSEEDALLAVAMDADAVGFLFAPSSRQMRPADVRDIVKRLPHETLTVGVFRNERPERVVEVVHETGVRAAQLHGGEPDDHLTYVKERVPVLIQALAAGSDRLAGVAGGPADILLLDSPEPGSGKVFDWSLFDGAPTTMKTMLAGGLTPDNVETAIDRVRPWGVDVSTGVEAAPGQKDATKVRRFVEAARRAEAALAADDQWQPIDAPPYDWMEDA